MIFDFWYGDTLEDVKEADCYFYPNNGYYAGNMYNNKGEIIGDYTSCDSVKIGEVFPGIFGE